MSGITPDKPSMYCLQCRYVLDGLPEPRCPECGTPFDPDDRVTFLVPAQMKWINGKPVRFVLSWLVLIVGTYVAFLAGEYLWWIGSVVLCLLIRKAGPNAIPPRIQIPSDRRLVIGCLLSPLRVVLEVGVPLAIAVAMFFLALKLQSMGIPRVLFAVYMTLPALMVYGIFMVPDALHIRRLSHPSPPGCCANCHYNLRGNVQGEPILPPRCPNCHTPL